RRPASRAPAGVMAARRSGLAQDDNHHEGVPGALQDLVALEPEEPLDELEAADQLDERPELLREDHPREMRLAVPPPRAVFHRLQRHSLADDLAHRVHVAERRERSAHDEPPAALGPRPAPG